jgi:hypothetical protein
MPAIAIKDREHYMKATEVLDRVGGAWQGVGQDKRYLLVTLAQYDALVQAGVATPLENGKEAKHGKKPRKRIRS